VDRVFKRGTGRWPGYGSASDRHGCGLPWECSISDLPFKKQTERDRAGELIAGWLAEGWLAGGRLAGWRVALAGLDLGENSQAGEKHSPVQPVLLSRKTKPGGGDSIQDAV